MRKKMRAGIGKLFSKKSGTGGNREAISRKIGNRAGTGKRFPEKSGIRWEPGIGFSRNRESGGNRESGFPEIGNRAGTGKVKFEKNREAGIGRVPDIGSRLSLIHAMRFNHYSFKGVAFQHHATWILSKFQTADSSKARGFSNHQIRSCFFQQFHVIFDFKPLAPKPS